MKIYVVTGGWYNTDEHEEWLICAYTDENKAKEHAANAKRRNDEIQNEPHPWDCPRCPKGIVTVGFFGYPIKTRCDNSKGFVCPNQKPTNEYDPNHRDNYDNEYSVEEVELVESP